MRMRLQSDAHGPSLSGLRGPGRWSTDLVSVICATVVPPLEEVAQGHFKACIRNDLTLQNWDGQTHAMPIKEE